MIWVVIVAVALGSLAMRAAPLLALHRIKLSERHEQLIRAGGVAAISALIATSARQTAITTRTVPTMLAVSVGAVAAARGSTMIRVLLFGAATYAAAMLLAVAVTGS